MGFFSIMVFWFLGQCKKDILGQISDSQRPSIQSSIGSFFSGRSCGVFLFSFSLPFYVGKKKKDVHQW